MKPSNSLRLSPLLFLAATLPAMASTFTYSNSSANATDLWNAGSNWSTAPVSAATTELRFIDPNSTVFGNALTITSNNDIAGPFLLNILDLQGSQPTSTLTTVNITGNALQFVSNGATTPVVNLNAAGTPRLTYNIASNVVLTNHTLFTGNGTATFNLTGNLSGTGSLTKTGSSTLVIGNQVASNTVNQGFLYSGDINASGGTLQFTANGNVFTKSKVTIVSGGTFDAQAGNSSIFSIFGTAGTLKGTSGGTGNLFINYAGTDAAAGFTGTVSSSFNLRVMGAGSGNLTFGTLGGNGSFSNTGSGLMTAVALTGNNGSPEVFTPNSTIKLTGTSGRVGGGSVMKLGGTVIIAPTGSGANVLVTGQDSAVTGTSHAAGVRLFYGGGTLKLDKGSNTSVNYQIGTSTSTSSSTLPLVNWGSAPGTLILDPVTGVAALGSTAKFTVLKGATQANVLPQVTNGLVNTSMVVVDNDSTKKADFVTYAGTGISSDVGFQQATYTLTNTFAGSSNTSSVKTTGPQTIAANTSAFALRNDSTISINPGVILTLGAPTAVANANADATTSPHTGLILNGGSITGGTLAFGATQATIYTSGAGGTISAAITGGGGTNSTVGVYSGAGPVSLDKFGAGTLYLTGANAYTGATVINSGAVDVGTITTGHALAGSSGTLIFGGGVLQGNGTFARSLGSGPNNVTWNGINASYSQMGGGFAAKGGDLTVAIGGTVSPTALVWGNAPAVSQFITSIAAGNTSTTGVGMLVFGSDTSTGQVDFKNAIDLGTNAADPVFYRTIMVNQGTGTDIAKLSGVISSTTVHGLIKDGAGRLVLSGANTYTGDTVVAAGTLSINGNQAAASGAVTVNSGAILGGSGTIGGAVSVQSGGHFAPGNSISSTFATGALTLAGGSFTDIELGTAGASHAAPGTSDRSAVSGVLTLGGTLNVINNAGANGDGGIGGGSYQIFTQTGTPTGSFSAVVNAAGYHAKVDTATSGSVYLDNYALASAGTIAAKDLGKARVGGSFSGSGAVTVTNATAANNGFTEGLNATQGPISGDVIAGGSNVSNLAGASSSTSLSVRLSTGTSGAKSGTTTIGLWSSGANSAYADSSLGSQTVGVSGSVYDYATAVFSQASGAGTFAAVSPTSYTLDFGSGLALNTDYTATLWLANGIFGAANAYQDSLRGAYTLTSAGQFSTTGTADFTGLASGDHYSFTVKFNTGATGDFSGNLAMNGHSVQDGLGDASLSTVNITIAGAAIPEPAAAMLGGLGLLALLRRRR